MAETGRAVVLFEHGQPFEVVEYPVPAPEPGAALIRIALSSVCGSNVHGYFSGKRVGTTGLPRHQGHEGVGRIAALGEGVTTDTGGLPLAVGDRVTFSMFTPCGRCRACLLGKDWCCPDRRKGMGLTADVAPHFWGTFGDYYYAVPTNAIFRIPDELSDELTTGVNCAMATVYNGWDRIDLQEGENVVIQGVGGLGLYALAIARERGAHKVIVIDGVPERLEAAAAFGADEIVDLREVREPAQRIRRVKELTGGWGVDAGMEVTGNVKAVEEGIQMLGQGGRYVSVGMVRAGSTYPADPELWVHGNLAVFGANNFGKKHLKGALDLLHRTHRKYPYERIISHRYPLEQVNEAFQDQHEGHVTRACLVP